jgi:hypothetical protein
MSSATVKVQEDFELPADLPADGRIDQLATVHRLKPDPYERTREAVPLHCLNLLVQVREEYEEEGIAELGNDIAATVEQHPAQVAIKSASGAQNYIDLLNDLWHCGLTLDDLVPLPGRKRRYAIVISGHRRTLAKRYIWQHGCESCRESYGVELPGVCFARHFHHGGDRVEVFCYRQVTPELAMGMQLRENIRQNVPSHRQAVAYDQLYALMKRQDPTLSVARFAREVGGVADGTVRRALSYCSLPRFVQQAVEQGQLSYSLALELGRLRGKVAATDLELQSEMVRIIAGDIKHTVYKKFVDQHIRDVRSGCLLFGIGITAEAEIVQRRAVFERRTVEALHGYDRYFRQVQPLLECGAMGKGGEFLDTSARVLLGKLLRQVEAILPLLESDDARAASAHHTIELALLAL